MKSNEMIKFRKDFNMSQTDLAKLIGVTPAAVNFWETNQRRISEPVSKLLKLLIKFPQLKDEV